MITKILFTAAVIVIAYLYIKGRDGERRSPGSAPVEQKSSAELSGVGSDGRLRRYMAYALLGVMLAGSGLFIFLEWQDQYRVVTVKVINTNTGTSVTYRARRGAIDGRGFETLDGRRVLLADVERMELGER